jgi:hypothetical protein
MWHYRPPRKISIFHWSADVRLTLIRAEDAGLLLAFWIPYPVWEVSAEMITLNKANGLKIGNILVDRR